MKLPRRSTACEVCEKAFEPGSHYFSRIDGEERHDYCPACWQPKGEFWQGKIPLRKEKSPDEKALNLFRKREDFRYLLALYLERRKELAYRGALSKKGQRCYEVLQTGELFYVPIGIVKKEAVEEVAAVLDAETAG